MHDLSQIVLTDNDRIEPGRQLDQLLVRKGPDRNGAKASGGYSFSSGKTNGLHSRSGSDAVGKEGYPGVVHLVGLDYHQDHLYVTDVGDHKVKIFDLEGRLLKEFGGSGSAAGKFAYPNGVTVAPDGKIYVADSNNGRVQVFDRDYRYLETLPQPASDRDKILHPRSVAVDKLGRIHVLDTLRGLVHAYSADHEYLFNYGQGETAGARLRFPNSISIDEATGLIFIADRSNNRLAVWAGK